MTVNDIYKWLDSFAPFETQEEFDNAGLLVGSQDQEVHKVLFALDATPAVVTEAMHFGAELIVTHHPLMFEPMQQLRYDQGEGAILKMLAASNISLIAAHTNLDQCAGGVADNLAEALALDGVMPSGNCPYLRTGTLPSPCTAKAFLATINRRLSAAARLYGDPDAFIRRVAVVPGAGGAEQIFANADVFVTGEIKHHELLATVARGLTVIDAGHYPTEFPGIAALHKRFITDAAKNGWNVEAKLHTQPPFPQITDGYPAHS
ncbi:MAG: Nif3-like dinuclear metal center hexameric protein [Clostridiales bacterium]|nr:Nif3-like dinuclear metal center hexameric protein [Clostridiales bacterium]